MIGKSLSHYRILDKLGAGGMGDVYLAKDVKLDREVALKFLPVAMAEDPKSLPLHVDPGCEPLRTDPRFAKFVGKVGVK